MTCAHELIGCELVWDDCAGIIVETEAYAAQGDEACHTFARPSARAFVATQQPGTAYVYLNYGMYWLFNVLIKGGQSDGFVLIRALEPTCELEAMTTRRFPGKGKFIDSTRLCSGPGKLTIALGISGQHHGIDLCASKRRGFRRHIAKPQNVVADTRVGISKAAHFPWRFLKRESEFVSVKQRAT